MFQVSKILSIELHKQKTIW